MFCVVVLVRVSECYQVLGMQKNKNHAVFYKYNNKVMRMIVDVQIDRINIVTFYFIEHDQIPRI